MAKLIWNRSGSLPSIKPINWLFWRILSDRGWTIVIILGNMPSRRVVVDIETIPCVDSMRHLIPRPQSPRSPGFWRRLLDPLFRTHDNGDDPYQQTALNWAFGRIICVGLLVAEDNQPVETRAFLAQIADADTLEESLTKESEVLKAFWEAVCADDYFIGHNILNFDLPFLWNRSLVCNVRPSRALRLDRESVQFTFDTMQVWGQWSRSPGRQYIGLDSLSQILRVGRKTGAGSQVYDLWRQQRFEEIRDYCLNDVKLEYDLYCRLTLNGSAPLLQWSR